MGRIARWIIDRKEFKMLSLFQILSVLDQSIRPEDCKVHLAIQAGRNRDNPLIVYLEGNFDRWQEFQTRKNFKRKLVVSLIQLPQRDRWLFAGVHESKGFEPPAQGSRCYRYNLSRLVSTDTMCGRLVVDFKRSGRQSYLDAEHWVQAMLVAEIRAMKMQVAEFPGFTQTKLTKAELDIIVRQQIESWRSALSCVAGVYVIADTSTGMLYIGSATGDQGIWGRWTQYTKNGHGGNKELRALLKDRGPDHAQNFVFGILETADSSASEQDVVVREAHWKDLLLTRSHGYNSN